MYVHTCTMYMVMPGQRVYSTYVYFNLVATKFLFISCYSNLPLKVVMKRQASSVSSSNGGRGPEIDILAMII